MTDLLATIKALLAGLVYLGSYPGTVRLVREDGSVDVELDDAVLRGRGLSALTVLEGVAGASYRVTVGTRCLVGFDGGDTSKPSVRAWSYLHDSAIVTLGDREGASRVARDGDVCELSIGAAQPLVGYVLPPSEYVANVILETGASTLPPGTWIELNSLPTVPGAMKGAVAFAPGTARGTLIASQSVVTG